MSSVWILCPKWWSLATVQSIFSAVLATLASPLASGYVLNAVTYRLACMKIFDSDGEAPLSDVIPLTSPGDVWETLCRRKLAMMEKKNRGELFLSLVIMALVVFPMFVSTITNTAVQYRLAIWKDEINISWTVRGDGSTGNFLDGAPLWNEIMTSLDDANFPFDQLLEFLPDVTEPWVYVAQEWAPTWKMTCNFTAEILLPNLTGTGNNNFYHPLDDFPAYRATFSPRWLATPEFRTNSDFVVWSNSTLEDNAPFKEALLFTIIQSNPSVNNASQTNNKTLQLSISALHTQDFRAVNYLDTTQGAADPWRPAGPVGNASYTRVECSITPRSDVLDRGHIPYPWTNDTYSIALAYRSFWALPLQEKAARNLTISPPTSKELLRFYQAYMVQVNTMFSVPTRRDVSTKKARVHIHVSLIILVCAWVSVLVITLGLLRFSSRQKRMTLKRFCLPSSRAEIAILGARLLLHAQGLEDFEVSSALSSDIELLSRVHFPLSQLSQQELVEMRRRIRFTEMLRRNRMWPK